MSAVKKENKIDKTDKSGSKIASTTTQNQTTSETQNTNNNIKPLINLPIVAPIPKSPQAKVDLASNKTPISKVQTIESKEHFENILKDAGDKFVVVEFYATWCNPCKLLSLKLDELSELYKDRVIIVKIDVDTLEELAIEYDVTNMPAFMIMKDSSKLDQFAGSKVELLDAAFEKYMGKAKE